MEFKDYYKVLGVERSATQDDVKQAFRKLARKYHPDINKEPDAEAQFKEINEANEVLSDPEKRAAYDQLGQSAKPGEDFRPPPNWDAGFEFSGAGSASAHDFSDFFETLFAGARRRGAYRQETTGLRIRGEDHHARIMVDLKDAIEGGTRTISLRVPEVDATGHVVVRDRTLNVRIPKGVADGQNIRLKGQGAPGLGGAPAGDLYLEISLKPDPLYRISGRDLYLELPVAPWEAALGASVRTPTPLGPVMLTIPPGSFQGRELRIKGRGIPGNVAGDLYAVLKIVLPPAETEKAKKAYMDMQRELAFDPRANLGG